MSTPNIKHDYDKFLSVQRRRKSSLDRGRIIDEFYSDRSRILFSSSFRRLQQKAQVFSLEPNASVRTRLTHSLEVADLGRTLANKIAYRLHEEKKLTSHNIPALVAVVENSCLLHDIGNPPFGHFGEAAIKDWAKNIKEKCPKTVDCSNPLLDSLLKDFLEFDGNPQGFRVVTKLHTDYDENSLNLTYATLLCILKYSRAAGEDEEGDIFKKAGYFQTEKTLIEEIYKDMEMEANRRYPFVYIMEAVDDIAYCMSDIADGIEKGILSEEKFIAEFEKEWKEKYPNEEMPIAMPGEKLKGFTQDISIPWSTEAIKVAVEQFFNNENDVFLGKADSLIRDDSPIGHVLKTMKDVSRRLLYTSFEAENIEITGYAVITGILEKYSRLLKMDKDDFDELVETGSVSGGEYERRLYNRLGKRYVTAYKYAKNKLPSDSGDYCIKEWWLRAHLIIDHVSGMTDEYALETYQMLGRYSSNAIRRELLKE